MFSRIRADSLLYKIARRRQFYREIVCKIVACFALAFINSNAYADLPHFQDDFPLHALHLAPQVREMRARGSEQVDFEFNAQWGNSFYDWDEGRIDAETVLLAPRIAVATDRGYVFAAAPRLEWSGSGRLDSVIEGWHNFFNLPNGRRQDARQDQYIVSGQSDQGEFEIDRHSLQLSAATFEFEAPLASDFALRARLDLAGQNERSQADTDATVLYRRTFEKFELHAGAGVLYLCDDQIDGLGFRKLSANGFVGAQVKLFNQVNFSSAVSVAQEAIDNVAALPRAFVYLDSGLEITLGDETKLTVGLRENPYGARATSDVVGLIGVRKGFGL